MQEKHASLTGHILTITHNGRKYRGPIKRTESYTSTGYYAFDFLHDDLSAARTGDPGRYKPSMDGGTWRVLHAETGAELASGVGTEG
jgi:hypothetical protein